MAEPRTGVLFVCLGNICRSPMAHGVMRRLVADAGLSHTFDIDSCGTAAYHVGEDMDVGTARVLRAKNAMYRHEARQLREADFDRFQHVLAMDRSNLQVIQTRYPHLADRVRLALEPTGGGDVPDPWGGSRADFEAVYQVLAPALRAWLAQWT